MKENRKHGIITVYPQGMDDYYDGDFEKSWNVPYKPLDPTICKPDTQPMCYDSCQKLGLCFQCSWSTCYDDVKFIEDLVSHLKYELCIDEKRTMITGASNGGMFIYYLAGQRSDLFKGWML